MDKRLKAATDERLAPILAMVADEFDPSKPGPHSPFRFYVASFCEDGNLLSQWRAYGAPGSGVSLAFHAARLEKAAARFDPARSIRLQRVLYSPRVQMAIVSLALDRLCDKTLAMLPAEEVTAEDVTACAASIVFALADLLPILKHPVFSEEREWRLIYSAMYFTVTDRLMFRQAGPSVVPYLVFDLTAKSGKRKGLLPLAAITHAPSPEPENRKHSLRELLRAKGYPQDTVEVKGSDIPLRIL